MPLKSLSIIKWNDNADHKAKVEGRGGFADPDQISGSEWERLSQSQKQGIIDAIAEIDAGKGVPEKEVLDNFRKKYSHA